MRFDVDFTVRHVHLPDGKGYWVWAANAVCAENRARVVERSGYATTLDEAHKLATHHRVELVAELTALGFDAADRNV